MRNFLLFSLIMALLIACRSKPPAEPEVQPEIQPEIIVLQPTFNIVSISIIKAELINTEFEAAIRIDNPNDFPLNLSSLTYELYGNGAFWASGKGEDILHIPANSSSETHFRFIKNFMGMNRRLLDDIIALRDVAYRFAGTVIVEAGIPNVPPFYVNYEISGFSEVRRNLFETTRR